MSSYKHTQVGYLMICVTLLVATLFAYAHLSALAEPPSYDSGPNLAVTVFMLLVLGILGSFSTLTTYINAQYLGVKFGYGVFSKKFPLTDIASVQSVRNRWYYGWGIRVWFWPYMWIYNISGFDAVEIVLKDKKVYRIGTDTPHELEAAIKKAIGQ